LMLSKAAKALIAKQLHKWPTPAPGKESEPEPTEPSLMPPSTKPEQYSKVSGTLSNIAGRDSSTDRVKWCSYCFDFAVCLLLCVGCRCGICVNTPQTSRGCAIWQECIEDDDFVFHCKRCTVHWRVPCPVSHLATPSAVG